MGLFDTKYCDICHEKISLMGNRKVEDGNVCKNCAAKLSPFMSGRRHTSLQDIRAHLEYREKNRETVARFNPTTILGNATKVYVDTTMGSFLVTRSTNWRDENPDIIPLSQVSSVNTDINEHKKELYMKNSEGKSVSYNPKRYEYSYEFKVRIIVNSPYFDEISFELSDSSNRPKNTYDAFYSQLQMQANQIQQILMSGLGNGINQMGTVGQMSGINQMGSIGQTGGMSQADINIMNGMNLMGVNQVPDKINEINQSAQMNQMYGTNQFSQMYGMNQSAQMNPQYGNVQQSAYPQYGVMQQTNMQQSQQLQYQQAQQLQQIQQMAWKCSYCDTDNTGAFCTGCGQARG